jgi:sugar lactone lactonase YvrE
MKNWMLSLIAFGLTTVGTPRLQQVAISNAVWNGVTVTADHRIFVCFPRIEGDTGMRIGEVLAGGKIVPYPDGQWNDWTRGSAVNDKFVRTNSLRIGPDGLLWIVDTGTPVMGADPLPGNASKLVAIDTRSNKVVRIIPLAGVSRKSTFVDDLRIYGNTIYLTDAGDPALIVMDKTTGKGRRILEHHQSTTDELAIKAEGKIMRNSEGAEVRIHADQLEVSPDGKWLYYQPASGPLWRIETKYLRDTELSDAALSSHAMVFYQTPSTGGTAMDAEGNIYVSDVDHLQIIRLSPTGKQSLVISDKRLLWCDAMWIDENGFLWMPTGQLNRLAPFQQGVNKVQVPVVIYKMKIGARPFRS